MQRAQRRNREYGEADGARVAVGKLGDMGSELHEGPFLPDEGIWSLLIKRWRRGGLTNFKQGNGIFR